MPTIKVVWIPCEDDKPIEIREIPQGSLPAMQNMVGGFIEAVDIDDPEATIFLNEEGKLRQLESNRRMSALLWVHHSAFRNRDIIQGDSFIAGRPDEHGNTTSAPDHYIDLVTLEAHYKVQVRTHGGTSWSGNNLTFITWLDAYLWALGLASRWLLVKDVRVITV
jgi:hypothetical protein